MSLRPPTDGTASVVGIGSAALNTRLTSVESGTVLNPEILTSGEPDGVRVTDAAITASAFTLSTASHTFVTADVGKVVIVFGAGTGGRTLTSTIASVSSGNAVLTHAAATTVSGATATWGTDNTAHLQSVIDDADAGSTVWITQGLWFAERLTLRDGLSIEGTHGAGIQQHSRNILADAALQAVDPYGTQGLIGYNSHSANFVLGKVAIRNLTLRGEGQKTTSGYQQSGIWISQGGEDITVEGCFISDFYAAGVYAPNVRRLKVDRCYVGNVGYSNGLNAIDAGISSYKSDGDDLKDVTITNNTVENCPAAGICYQPFKDVGTGHFTITGNHVRNCGWVGIVAEGGYVNGGNIANNVVEKCLYGYMIVDSHNSSSALDQLQAVTFANNVCKSGTMTVTQVANTTNLSTTITVAATFGTEMVGATVTGSGIPGGTTIAAKLTGTTYQLSAAATATATDVYLTFSSARNYGAVVNSSRTTITGNVLEGSVLPALQVAGNSTTSRRVFGVRVSGNQLHHASSDTSASDRNGLRAFYLSELDVTGNTITFAGTGAHKGMYLSDVDGGGATDNTIVSPGWHGALLEDVSAFVWGGNKVLDWNQKIEPDGAGVKLIGTTSGTGSYLRRNVYHDRDAHGVYGVWNASTATWYEDGELAIGATTLFNGTTPKTALDARVRPTYGFDLNQSGVLAPQNRTHGTTLTVTANRAYVGRFILDTDRTLTKIAFKITTVAANNDNVDVGIYTVTGNDTLTKLASSGATASKLNSTGVQTVTLAASLKANTVYYAAISCAAAGTAATFAAVQENSGGVSFGDILRETYGIAMMDLINTSHPLPTTLTRNTGTGVSVPVLGVRWD